MRSYVHGSRVCKLAINLQLDAQRSVAVAEVCD